MKLKWHRLNSAVSLMVCLQLACPECGAESVVTDNIDGELFTDTIYCPKCGAKIKLFNENSPKTTEKVDNLLDEFLKGDAA